MLSNSSRGTLMSYTDHSVQRRFKSNTPTDWILPEPFREYIYIYILLYLYMALDLTALLSDHVTE